MYDVTLKYTPEFLRGMTSGDLDELLDQAQRGLFRLREQTSGAGRVKFVQWPHLFRKVKRDIARIRTILSERKLYVKVKGNLVETG